MADPGLKKQRIDDAVRFLLNPAGEEARQSMREWAQDRFDWGKIVDIWHETIGA